jgi:predicted ArsR family transcriptional regulator
MINEVVKVKSVEEDILKVLKKSSFSLTIDEISRKIGITRQTTSKYLLYLEAKGEVQKREVGTAKLYFIGNRGMR